MPIFQVIFLAIVQGLAELLPVSSSAHVIVAEKLLGLDPSSPQLTLLLVMLHTGTMFAVIVFFWKTWKETYFSSAESFKRFAFLAVAATALTAIVGETIKIAIERTLFRGAQKTDIEQLFSHLELIAPAMAAAGVLILIAGLIERRLMKDPTLTFNSATSPLTTFGAPTMPQSLCMGLVQGLALPFRGFSRSGSTISAGLLTGTPKAVAERFSFALAVVLTPPVIAMELARLLKAAHQAAASGTPIDLHAALLSSLLGMIFSFFAGLLALKWLSSWLESGRWYLFGIYCLFASAAVYLLHAKGF
jgi:undecaprenyl-diphosphatase